MAVLKVKNGTAGVYNFQYRDPESNKLIVKSIEPMATQEVYNGHVDKCSVVRLQYPNLPDNGDASLKDVDIQFVWEGVLPSIDDYQASLKVSEDKAATDALATMQKTVADVAQTLPNESSNIQVKTAGKKAALTATGVDNE